MDPVIHNNQTKDPDHDNDFLVGYNLYQMPSWNLFNLELVFDSPLTKYTIHVIIENKPYINDPEGETIHRDLVVKGGYRSVQTVRSAKMLKIVVNSRSEQQAEQSVKKLCEELRIYNPVVSNCTIKASSKL